MYQKMNIAYQFYQSLVTKILEDMYKSKPTWHDKMNCLSFSELIQCKRPIIVNEDSTHHE